MLSFGIMKQPLALLAAVLLLQGKFLAYGNPENLRRLQSFDNRTENIWDGDDFVAPTSMRDDYRDPVHAEDEMEGDTEAQGEFSTYDIVYATLGRFTAALSMLGSVCIILEVIAENRAGVRQSMRSANMIVLSMSISDICFSFGCVWGNSAVPAITSDYLYGASGSFATCSLQGFLIQLGFCATPMFNVALSSCYLLTIRYNWHERDLRRYSAIMQAFVWLWSGTSAILPLFFDLYNPFSNFCWVTNFPKGCEGDDCIRGGDSAPIWTMVLQTTPGWACFPLTGIFMGMIWWTVRVHENNARKRTIGETQLSTTSRRKSKVVASQAIWYVAAFYFTFLPDAVSTSIAWLTPDHKSFLALDLVAYTIALPLQVRLCPSFFTFCLYAYLPPRVSSPRGS